MLRSRPFPRRAAAVAAFAATAAALAAPAVAAAPQTGGGSAAKRPNVILVLIDDAGYADLSCYNPRAPARTENIDRLAREGVRFTQFYVNSPICSPSRTALLTGQYPARWNVTSYIAARQENDARGIAHWLDPNAPSLARALSGAGYATGHFGKWHLGGGRDIAEAPLITQYGFDASLTQFEGLGDRVLAMMDTAPDGSGGRKMGLGAASEKLGRGSVRWVPRHQVTKTFVDGALGFVRDAEKAGKPFFVNVWPDDVHSPFDPPADLRGDGSKKALYRGVLVNMDRQLAPLFDYVRSSPALRDNTLILVMSDNGPEPGAGSAGGLRGTKGQIYEGGVREPLVAWGPGLIPAARRGTVNQTAVFSSVDLTASILRLAGATMPESAAAPGGAKAAYAPDGEDVRPALFGGEKAAGRTAPLFFKRPPDRPGPPRAPLPDLAVREGNWKLLLPDENGASAAQLYDLAADRGETKDVAAQHPDVVARLKEKLLAWNRTLPAASKKAAAARP
ncbi:MAG TPA: sulfatase-like hydrolase/transferase [Armatimonadaceae bacterium]|nr:sulfatase-like hydrolase/transferase [Armatimonadaceae bacterium]